MTIFTLHIFWLTIAPSYYWLMYAISFLIWYYLVSKTKVLSKEKLDNLFLYIVFWVILGWRIWYILFYDLAYYLENPLSIFKVWEWWMSFHGWALWVIIATLIFSKVYKESFLKIIDEICLILPIWLFFWRIWNYLNKELLGWPYSWFLAVEKNGGLYFPSPLLEAFLEWFVLFLILYFISKRKKYLWQIWVWFFIWYWVFRTIVELFFRLPDVQIWYIFHYFTIWSILSIIMIIVWILFSFILRKKYEVNIK
jgi:phosphatidylglycerol:prolipoprotein diacylglycerol transferase